MSSLIYFVILLCNIQLIAYLELFWLKQYKDILGYYGNDYWFSWNYCVFLYVVTHNRM